MKMKRKNRAIPLILLSVAILFSIAKAGETNSGTIPFKAVTFKYSRILTNEKYNTALNSKILLYNESYIYN